ncbi:mitochondrial inner membrane protein required for protein import [Mycoemilia scoparia]|uniref:Mitochondrial import inner membrane translocase subunit TIM50 n=1 Tax=Mycoemilia scoparia TaxID=417184 RepID=A0A9W7ZXC0_9FUNG|nr:mitochondrial inner membrane protein required for protein import [Mycoemilia scoparia]
MFVSKLSLGAKLQLRNFNRGAALVAQSGRLSQLLTQQNRLKHTVDSNEKNADKEEVKKESTRENAASPFGFTSAGKGLASEILGSNEAESGAEEASGRSNSGKESGAQDAYGGGSRSAAESRRARRLNSDLPPLEDEPSVKYVKFIGSGLLVGILLGSIGYYGRPYTEEEIKGGKSDSPDDGVLSQIRKRYSSRLKSLFSFFEEPALEQLLPDPNEYTMPYTLIVNLDETLIHTTWSKEYGWRIAKRPHLDKFLSYMASMYEVVIFTSQPAHSGERIMQKLDPLGYAPFRLYKECMSHINGKNVKDLSRINRDLSRVIVMDVNPEMFSRQSDNGIQVKPWRGEAGDDWLDRIIPFFEYLHMMEPKDVRPWLKVYQGKDLPEEFAKWEDSVRAKLRKDWEEKQAKKRRGITGWLIGNNIKENEQPPELQMDYMRRMMRENFKIQHKKMLEMAEKERKQLQEEADEMMKDMTIWKLMTEGPPAPPGAAPTQ